MPNTYTGSDNGGDILIAFQNALTDVPPNKKWSLTSITGEKSNGANVVTVTLTEVPSPARASTHLKKK